MPHDTHAPASVPQLESVGGVTQVPVAQHPVAQFDEWQVATAQEPPLQLAVPQLAHATPAVPQAVWAVPVRHWPAEQQPVGHEVESHTQVPALHRWPLAHAGPVPQPHTPAEHTLAVTPQLTHAPPSLPQFDAPPEV